MISLDLRTLLPKTRAAFNAGTLQAQQFQRGELSSKSCNYTGPCAIGVGLSPDEQNELEIAPNLSGSTAIRGQLRAGTATAPLEQWDDLEALQSAHDHIITSRGSMAGFEATLTELEAKYLP